MCRYILSATVFGPAGACLCVCTCDCIFTTIFRTSFCLFRHLSLSLFILSLNKREAIWRETIVVNTVNSHGLVCLHQSIPAAGLCVKKLFTFMLNIIILFEIRSNTEGQY